MKILVACPTAEYKKYCLNEYVEGLKRLTYSHDILIIDNSENDSYLKLIEKKGLPVVKDKYLEKARARIVHSRNMIRKKVLEGCYDYFLSLEQDVIPPPDIIERLLRANKKIVTGVYYTRYMVQGKPKYLPLIWQQVESDKMRFMEESELNKGVQPIYACGLGCILIHKSVLEKIKFRYEEDKVTFDDMFFCKDARDNGFELFADTSLKCQHLIEGMSWKGIKK